MSRPGFPINMTQTITVHNNYHAVSGSDFPGTDLLLSRDVHEDKVGDNTPGWPKVVHTNGYSRYAATWRQSSLHVNGHADNGDTFDGEWGNTFGLGYVPTTDGVRFSQQDEITMVQSMLIDKLIDYIQSNRVNTGEILHTRSQAANMVASSANRIATAFNALRHGNLGGAATSLLGSERGGGTGSRKSPIKRHLGGIPEQWLALKYGWLPLLSDVYNSCELVRKAWHDNGDAFTATAKAKLNCGDKHYDQEWNGAWGPAIRYNATSRTVSGRASCTYRVDSSIESSLSQLGITNPLSLGWELLPYSFVVDWFIPIGNFLGRLDYTRGLVFDRGWLSFQAKQSYKSVLIRNVGTMPGYTAHWSGGTGSGSGFYFQRSPLTAFPSPPIPRLQSPFSLTHVSEALSLLAQAFDR